MNSLKKSVGSCIICKTNCTIADSLYISVVNSFSASDIKFIKSKIINLYLIHQAIVKLYKQY
jgi:hypothetical protein